MKNNLPRPTTILRKLSKSRNGDQPQHMNEAI